MWAEEGRVRGACLNGKCGLRVVLAGGGMGYLFSENLLSLPWQIPALLGQL